MIPSRASPTEIMPVVLPPTTMAPQERAALRICTLSCRGMPSAVAQILRMPASRASKMASLVKRGGTKSMATSAGCSRMPRRTLWYTGTPATSCPSLPGVTPKTTWVPISFMCLVQNEPSLPVTPWTATRLSLLTKMLIMPSPPPDPRLCARLPQYRTDWRDRPVSGFQTPPPHWCRECAAPRAPWDAAF